MCDLFVTCECVCVAFVAVAGRRFTYTVCTYFLTYFPAFCVGCAPRRACERRAAAASRQVALAAAKFAGLWILDSTLVSCLRVSWLEGAVPPKQVSKFGSLR